MERQRALTSHRRPTAGRTPRRRSVRSLVSAVCVAAATALTCATVPSAAAQPAAPEPSAGHRATPDARRALLPPTGPVTSGPGITTFPLAVVASVPHPDAPPPGADDWHCRPTPRHPRPVILIHGTYENAFDNWNYLSPVLKRHGYCVFTPNLGAPPGEIFKATRHIPFSARQLARYVERVRAATGARQVDLVGHSQGGGALPRWYINWEGGADPRNPARNKVRRLIALSPGNHGTTFLGPGLLVKELGVMRATRPITGRAIEEVTQGDRFNYELDRLGDTRPGVEYTNIVTRLDEVVTPYDHQYLKAGPGAKVNNFTIQDICPADLAEHGAISYDPVAFQLILNALDPATAHRPDCELVLPLLGAPVDIPVR